jgi:hypothetical protein
LKLLMKVKSICISAFKERQRETEGERETWIRDLECLHLWGPQQSENMVHSSLIR